MTGWTRTAQSGLWGIPRIPNHGNMCHRECDMGMSVFHHYRQQQRWDHPLANVLANSISCAAAGPVPQSVERRS